MADFNVRDPQLIEKGLFEYLNRKHSQKCLFSKGDKIKSVSEVELIDYDGLNISYKCKVILEDKLEQSLIRFYHINIYIDDEGSANFLRDQRHVAEIILLKIYEIGQYIFESQLNYFGSPFLIINIDKDQEILSNIRKTLRIQNPDATKQRMFKYLKRRNGFHRRASILLKSNEKFVSISSMESLALGLNNIVYSMKLQYATKQEPENFREFILRVYPNNKNLIKPSNEAKRYQQIEDIAIPHPKMYLFEKNVKYIGHRFLVIEKLPGTPVLETINSYNPVEMEVFMQDLAKYLGILHNRRSKTYDSYYIEEKKLKKYPFAEYIMMEVKNTLQNFQDMNLDKELDVDTRYLYKWFRGHKPLLQLSGFSLVHGDIRPSNIIMENGRIRGFIDWEMSCFSDPAQDIGWSLFFFKLYDDLKKPRGVFFAQYWQMSGKFDVEARVRFYEILAALKMYIYARYTEINQEKKYQKNIDFFTRVKRLVPQYIDNLVHRD